MYFFLLGSLAGHQGVLARRAGPRAWAKGGRVPPEGPRGQPKAADLPAPCGSREIPGRLVREAVAAATGKDGHRPVGPTAG